MPWHITPASNIPSIMQEGLTPRIGERSERVGEAVAAVHLFSKHEDLESANWIEDEFDADAALALMHVALPAADGAWTEVLETVPREKIRVICLDMDRYAPGPALRALDRVVDPFADIASFRATQVRMTAHDYGELVEDPQWAGDETVFLVYAAGSYIVEAEPGEYELYIDGTGWFSSECMNLGDLESKLFDWLKVASRVPAPSAEPEL